PGSETTSTSGAPSTSEAVKSNAAEPTTKAARLAALLTPEKKTPTALKKFDKAPVIDGKMDEEVWQAAAVFKDFVQYRPVDLVAPTKPTEVRIGYDAKTLYIAFHAFDEPDKVRATVAKRDNVFNDDWVGVWLDTFNDGRRSYELIFNPLGVQADAIFTEGVSEDFSVDIVMESKGSIVSDGYVVEVAIPFKSMRYTAGKDKLWGLHLLRTIKRFNNEQSSWMPISKDNSSLLGQRGYVTGLEGISTERTLELIPSFTISEGGERVPTITPGQRRQMEATGQAVPADAGRFLNHPLDQDIGLTAKFTLTPNSTLDFAYNPDFAQVEADATVVTANQRFPIFFEEKRPFFLEGKEIFETLISAVHTRTIVDPDYAFKFTGKQGRNTYGLMLASDNAPGNLTEGERDFIRDLRNPFDEREGLAKFLDKNATVGVLRLKRDFGKENHIGFLGTTYNFVDKHNHVGGFDSRMRLNQTTILTAQVLGSSSTRPFFYADEGIEADRNEKGLAYAVYLNNNGRNWGYELGSVGRSKYFRADLGFNRRFNTNNPTLFVRYNSNEKPKSAVVAWRVYNFTGSNFDWEGRHQRFVNETQGQLRLQRQTWVGLGFEKGYERVFEDEFGGTREAHRLVTVERFGRELAARLPACDEFGTLPAPDPARPDLRIPHCTFYGPDNERSADRTTVYGYVETAPSKKITGFFFTSYNWGALDFDFGTGNPRFPRVSPAARILGQDAPRDPGAGNEWFFEGNVAYQPTDELRLQLFYTKDRLVRRDTGLTAFDDNIYSLRGTYQFTRFWFARARADYTTLGSRVRMQYLLGWAPNPGTSFYVGYNDDLNRNGVNPFSEQIEPGFRRNGRLFFIKASYLFRRSIGN
ncbi:MAG: carbohydrate binding family 9 domain-containing protein, partial [Acidobacteriota bacterium]|nr:carbohydrate binding family 9 domain-containing protein [Acidobacteriota bacterium]